MRVVDVINVGACLLLSACCAWAVLSPKVRDGVFIKAGLMVLCGGLLALAGVVAEHAETTRAVENALAVVMIGLSIVAAGVWWRRRADSKRSLTDWLSEQTGGWR